MEITAKISCKASMGCLGFWSCFIMLCGLFNSMLCTVCIVLTAHTAVHGVFPVQDEHCEVCSHSIKCVHIASFALDIVLTAYCLLWVRLASNPDLAFLFFCLVCRLDVTVFPLPYTCSENDHRKQTNNEQYSLWRAILFNQYSLWRAVLFKLTYTCSVIQTVLFDFSEMTCVIHVLQNYEKKNIDYLLNL